MQVAAKVQSSPGCHIATVQTAEAVKAIPIEPKTTGGSAVNGGELLMLALATCYCNDLYREATRLGIELRAVQVEASATFGGIGLAASNVQYRARVETPASVEAVERLLRATDTVAEVHNTLRAGVAVELISSVQRR